MTGAPWINRYGPVALLLTLLLVMNPELRAFLLLINFIGLDLMILFIVIRPRHLMSANPSYRMPFRHPSRRLGAIARDNLLGQIDEGAQVRGPCGGVLDDRGNIRDTRESSLLELQQPA